MQYTMRYRPAGFATLPSNLHWEYVEAPARFDVGVRRPDLPISKHPFGVFTADRILTADELRSYEIDVVSSDDTLGSLSIEYNDWLAANKLPPMSCDELAAEYYHTFTQEQREYVMRFLERWTDVEDRDREARAECRRNGHRDTGRGVCANCGAFLEE